MPTDALQVQALGEPRPIAVVCIPTRDRPAALARALRSYWRNHRAWGRRPAYLVVDASEGPKAVAGRQAVSAVARQYGISIEYWDQRACSHYAAALAAHSGVSRRLVSFALSGRPPAPVTTGASRNAIQLLTHGHRVLQVDDDTVCRPRAKPDRSDVVGWMSAPDEIEHYFEPGDLRQTVPVTTDYLAVHERFLGRDVLERDRPGEAGRAREPRPTSRLVATMSGTYGDSGQYSPLSYLFLTGRSGERLLRNKRTYARALKFGTVLRTVRQPLVAGGVSCIAINLGLDNTQPLVPFLPVCRNQDGVFATLLNALLPGPRWGLLPPAIEHAPLSRRRFAEDRLLAPARRMVLSHLTAALIKEAARGPVGAFRPTRSAVGAGLAGFGALSAASFADLCTTVVTRMLDDRVAAVDERLDAGANLPDFLVQDLMRCRDEFRRTRQAADAWVPRDLGAPVAEARARTRSLIRMFGQLMESWEALLDSAHALGSGNLATDERWPSTSSMSRNLLIWGDR